MRFAQFSHMGLGGGVVANEQAISHRHEICLNRNRIIFNTYFYQLILFQFFTDLCLLCTVQPRKRAKVLILALSLVQYKNRM